jgi:hypothetical protein
VSSLREAGAGLKLYGMRIRMSLRISPRRTTATGSIESSMLWWRHPVDTSRP